MTEPAGHKRLATWVRSLIYGVLLLVVLGVGVAGFLIWYKPSAIPDYIGRQKRRFRRRVWAKTADPDASTNALLLGSKGLPRRREVNRSQQGVGTSESGELAQRIQGGVGCDSNCCTIAGERVGFRQCLCGPRKGASRVPERCGFTN